MRASFDIPDRLGAAALDAALEGLVEVGVAELSDPRISGADEWPTLYTSGVRYNRERDSEDWNPPSNVLALGWGDCEDLAAWRTAELRVTGEDPTARAVVIRSGPRTWHAVVAREDGTRIEDPSRMLGMGEQDEGMLLGWDFSCSKVPGGYQCTLMRDGQGVVGSGKLASQAIERACRQGIEGVDVGQIPGLDMLARIAQGALSAALPPPTPPRGPTSVQPPMGPTYPSGDSPEMSAEIARISRQISRVTSSEARRKLTAAQRAVRGR